MDATNTKGVVARMHLRTGAMGRCVRMYDPSITALPSTGIGTAAGVAALTGHTIVALLLASVCVILLAVMLFRYKLS